MTKYEKLIATATNEGAVVLEVDLGTDKMCGKCIDNMLIINNRLTENEKYCILAEELGHYHKTLGNIIDQTKIDNVKQEIVARQWSYRELVGIMDIIKAFEHGARNRFEMSEFLNITENFLEEALNYYKAKYGLRCEIDKYIIYFEPNLGILKMY